MREREEEMSDLNETLIFFLAEGLYKPTDFLEPIGKPKRRKILRHNRDRLKTQQKKST